MLLLLCLKPADYEIHSVQSSISATSLRRHFLGATSLVRVRSPARRQGLTVGVPEQRTAGNRFWTLEGREVAR